VDPKTILATLKEASPLDLFLISFLLLPFITDGWLNILEKLGAELNTKIIALFLVIIAYIIGIVGVLVGNTRTRRRELARDVIIQYLNFHNFTMMSYERVRQNINPSYADDFLESLVTRFPNALRKAKLKGGKPGLAKLVEESGNENEA